MRWIKKFIEGIKINKKNVKSYFYLSLLIYVAGILIYLVSSFYLIKKEINEKINNQLKIAANSVEYLLPIDYHDRAINRKAINEIEFNELMQLLSDHANNMGVKYIYSLVESNGKLYFTSSSATNYEMRTGQNLTYFWQEYSEAEPEFYEALDKFLIKYLDYTNRWGTFRSILIPKISPTGNKYLLGADVEITYIDNKIWSSLFKIFLKAVFFTLIILPIFYVFYKYFKINNEHLSVSLTQKELTAHHEKDMRRQLLEKFLQIEEKYSALLQYSFIPIIILDTRGKIIEVSQSFIEITGKSQHDFNNTIIFTIPFFLSVNDFENLIVLLIKKKL